MQYLIHFTGGGNCDKGYNLSDTERPKTMQEKGRKAAIKGYAYESIVLGMLMEKYGDVSRAGLPMAFYDLMIKIDKATIYAQVKTCSKRIRFTSGSSGKEYVQSTDTSDVVIGIRSKNIQTFELYFVPTVLIEYLNQKSISINKVHAFKDNYFILENCKNRELIIQKCKEYGIL